MNSTEVVTEQKRYVSEILYSQACLSIPKGVNSPVRAFCGLGMTPLVVKSGYQDEITDIDGNCYIDFCNSWGALIHGHAHPQVIEAAHNQITNGSSFGALTTSEIKIAQKVISAFSSIEQVRFVSSGTEATMSAVRLARGYTGRSLLVKFIGHYHGHADPFLAAAGSGLAEGGLSVSAGVPAESVKYTLSLPFNDFSACKELFEHQGHKIAAVILEPIAANMGVVLPKPGFLEFLREETEKRGIVLIFDEVITGFRVAFGGAQELYDIHADLTCLGKIVGGGFPAAAFGGKKEIMDFLAPNGPVYQAGTLSGNPVAMEAGYAALSLLEQPDFYQKLSEKTDTIVEPIEAYIKRKKIPAAIQSAPGLFTLFFGQPEVHAFLDKAQLDQEMFHRYFHFLFSKGVYVAPSQYEANFLSAAHTEEHLNETKNNLFEFIKQFY